MKIKISTIYSLLIVVSMAIMVSMYACEPKKTEEKTPEGNVPGMEGAKPEETKPEQTEQPSHKGVGEVKEVKLTDPLDKQMVKSGQMIYDMKCNSCHKLSEERVVGPGWAGVTNRRSPEWIMNMITNVDMMLEKDPQAQALLEQCLVRMPNQNVSVGDARNILEFMRDNDMKTVKKKDEAHKPQ